MTARCRNRNSRTWEPVFPGCGFPVNPAAGVYGTGSLHSLENMETETVCGLIAMSQGAPATVEEVVIPDPGPGDVVVRILTCGVCHTDLHYRDAVSTTTSHSCWDTRRRGSWNASATR